MGQDSSSDAGKSKLVVWVPVVVSALVALGGAIAWLYARHDTYQERIIAEEHENQKFWCQLKTIQNQLDSTRDTSQDLQTHFLEKGWGILESYVLKVRSDGDTQNAVMYQRIDSMVKTNDAIVSRLGLYEPNAITDEFKGQARAFISHAENYSARWRAVPSVIQSRKQLPVAIPFPPNFPGAISGEMKARDAVSSEHRSELKPWPGQGTRFPARTCQ